MVVLSNRKKDHEMHLYVILPTECAQAAVLMLYYCMKTQLLSHLFGVDTHHFGGAIQSRNSLGDILIYFTLAIDSITAAARLDSNLRLALGARATPTATTWNRGAFQLFSMELLSESRAFAILSAADNKPSNAKGTAAAAAAAAAADAAADEAATAAAPEASLIDVLSDALTS